MSRLHRGLAATAVCALGAAALAVAPTAALAAEPGIRINEVESSGGQPGDWIEFFNPTGSPVELGGFVVKDSEDDHVFTFPEGVIVEPGAYLVIEEGESRADAFDFGLGGNDRVRLFDPAGVLVDERAWTAHGDPTWGVTDAGEWAQTSAVTKGSANTFPAAPEPEPSEPQPEPTPPQPTPSPSTPAEPGRLVLNEIDSSPADWVEFFNPGSAALDISGYEVRDNSDDHRWAFPAGSSIAAGARVVVDAETIGVVDGASASFGSAIGIGSADRIRLYSPAGALLDDSGAWEGHAAIGGSEASATLARCPDGMGAFVLASPTPGEANDCILPVRINEVESDGGSPDDWIELVNPTTGALDVSGLVVTDDDPSHRYVLPAGTTIAANGHLVIERAELGFGLGGGDAVRLIDGSVVLDETTWSDGHAATTWGRCPDATGAFAVTGEATKGAANVCAPEVPIGVWPGGADVTALDTEPMFLEDSSGLDVQTTADGSFLWAVDNGTGTFWKLATGAGGGVSFADGWDDGRRARFMKDAANPAADGPDAEGITVAGDGYLYLASERDNSNKGVNQNVVLQIDPDAPGPDVVATREWDLTAQLPAVEANLGLEAIEWIADDDLVGALFATETGKPYDPADYPGHGDGLFFVAVEDTGDVYAFALSPNGSATKVATIDPLMTGVMALDYDAVLGVLWAVCDDGCGGTAAQITLNGTPEPGIAQVARPAGMPNENNEGFATAPAPLAAGGQRPVWWFQDGATSEALRVGTLPAPGDPGGPGEPGGPGGPGGPQNPGQPGGPTGPGGLPSTGGFEPLPGSSLVAGNRGGITVPPTAARGSAIAVSAGAASAGTPVTVWLYSTPVQIAAGTLDAAGSIRVTIPADASLGVHRIAVYTADGQLLGWDDIRITASGLAATGGGTAEGALLAGMLMLAVGAVTVLARRRARPAA